MLPPPHSPPSTLSPFLSEDWTAFCLQGSETQAVSAGNIFHSPGPTEALAATRYWTFQSLVLLGKYGSLWIGPLCRLGGRVGKDGCRWWRQLTDTARQCASQPAVAMRQHDRAFPLVKGVIYTRLFFHLGLELSIPGQCLLVILIIEYFPMELLETSFLHLSGKHSSTISNAKWKDKWTITGGGWTCASCVCGSGMLLLRKRTCRVKNWRHQSVLGHIILSRLHLMEETGLRRGVETQAWWERKSCRTTTAVSASTLNQHTNHRKQAWDNRAIWIRLKQHSVRIYCKWCGLAAFTDSLVRSPEDFKEAGCYQRTANTRLR